MYVCVCQTSGLKLNSGRQVDYVTFVHATGLLCIDTGNNSNLYLYRWDRTLNIDIFSHLKINIESQIPPISCID